MSVLLGQPREKKRIPIAQGRRIAERLMREIRPYAQYAIVAGSVRRGIPRVGDVEVVVLPRDLGQFAQWARDHGFRTGQKRRNFVRADKSGFKTEIYVAHRPEELGAMVLHFTGDWQWNAALATIAKRRGWKLNQYGIWDARTGKPVLESPFEEDLMGALGVDYHEPEDRSLAARPKGRARMAGPEDEPEVRTAGTITLRLYTPGVYGTCTLEIEWQDPMGGAGWEGEFEFDDSDQARYWFLAVDSTEELDFLIEKMGMEEAG